MFLGKVIVDDAISSDVAQVKAKINKRTVQVGMYPLQPEDLPELQKYYLLSLKCYESDYAKAYWVVKHDSATGARTTLTIIKDTEDYGDDEVAVFRLSLLDTNDDQSFAEMLSGMFQGEYQHSIDDPLDVLLKRYSPKSNALLYMFGGFGVFALVSFGYFLFSATEDPVKNQAIQNQPAQTIVKPLTQIESFKIQRELSKELIGLLKDKVEWIQKDSLRSNKSYIASVTMTYQQVEDKITMHGDIGITSQFAEVGSTLSNGNEYISNKPYSYEISRKNLSGVQRSGMSVECVKQALSIESGDPMATERDTEKIKIKYSGMRPTHLLQQVGDLLERCPAEIESIGLSSGKFDLVIGMYAGEDL